MSTRQIEFFDGFESAEKPQLGGVDATGLISFANDAAFVADLDRAAKPGDSYFNTTTGIARIYTGAAFENLYAGPITITDTHIVADEAAMLALTAERGDIAVRSDLLRTFILRGDSPTELVSWQELATPTDLVLSVAGRTGVVALDTSDVAENASGPLYHTTSRVDARITAQKGAANGLAPLDADSLVPIANIPPSLIGGFSYQAVWNATTNSPALVSSSGEKGHVYIVGVAGATNLNGITDWGVGDWAWFDGTAWRKVDNSESVTSVNAKTGAVALVAADIPVTPAGALASANAQAALEELQTDVSGREPALGNPGTDGQVLSSTTAGARSWITPAAGGGGAATGSGAVNYLPAASRDAEAGVGAWTVLTPTATAPLSGTASFLYTATAAAGTTAELAFTTDRAAAGKVQVVEFDYEIAGTYTDGQLEVWVHDVTSGVATQVAPSKIMNAIGPQKFRGYVQTHATNTSYKLQIKQPLASSNGAFTVKLDSFSVGPGMTTAGMIGTGWKSFTPTWQSYSNPQPILGNGIVSGSYRRVGDCAEVTLNINTGTTTSSYGTSNWLFGGMPFSIDTAKLPYGGPGGVVVGHAKLLGYNGATFNDFHGTVEPYDANRVQVFITNTSGTYSGGGGYAWQQGHPATFQNHATVANSFSLKFTVPVVGWDTTALVTADSATRVASFSAKQSVAQSIPYNSATKLVFGTVQKDSAGTWDSLNNRYKVGISGTYQIATSFSVDGIAAAQVWGAAITVWKTGSPISYSQPSSGTGHGGVFGDHASNSFAGNIDLVAGDYIEIYAQQANGATAAKFTVINATQLSITRVAALEQTATMVPTAGFAGSDWISYTPSVAYVGTAATAILTGVWRRVGDSAEIRIRYYSSSVGSGSTSIAFSLPPGLVADSTKDTGGNRVNGTANIYGVAGDSTFKETGVLVSSNGIGLLTSGGGGSVTGANIGANTQIEIQATVPIAGWSSNVTMASSSTFKISSYLASGTRVTTTPTKLGEYRAMVRSASSVTYTDVAPSVLPTIASGVRLYNSQGYTNADAANSPTRYQIFVGKNKTVIPLYFYNTENYGFADTKPQIESATIAYGVLFHYEPITGVVECVANFIGTTTTHFIARNSTNNGLTSGFMDLVVSENALAVGLDPVPPLLNYGLSASSGGYSTAATAITQVPNLSVTVNTSGRPVEIVLVPDGSGSISKIGALSSASNYSYANFYIYDGAVKIAEMPMFSQVYGTTGGSNFVYPPSMVHLNYVPSAGAHTYTVRIACGDSNTTVAYAYYCKLWVREL